MSQHSSIEEFIADARKRGMADAHIAKLLETAGWPNELVETALLGLSVPLPPPGTKAAPAVQKTATDDFGRTISTLEASLQHILLWVFTLTSTVMFGVVSATLFSSDDTPGDLLKTYFVIELLTFIPFAIMFGHYIRDFQKHHDLKTGRIWSTITIVMHSIGLMSALITFVLAILLIDNHDTKMATAIGAFTIGLINGFVVAAYVAINYTKNFTDRLRNAFIVCFPLALLVITCVFGFYSLAQFIPIKQDQTMRKNLSKTTASIRQYTKIHKTLPQDITQLGRLDAAENITYKTKTNVRYELCANFATDSSDDYSYRSDGDEIEDSYADEYYFTGVKKGDHCFIIVANELEPAY